ncbi:MAG: bifunctional UDP-N-acetylmuramoyl-tripeptide:D-alanyl-D-alanine ligase/alanine racemase [Bacteroidota bacterium]|nr:bifunctional UDP-N-acetylmuramoyl-tripeptide:D-alanyl-D-alanine ligase/alanine racemase [Bacteroidota bacterium]
MQFTAKELNKIIKGNIIIGENNIIHFDYLLTDSRKITSSGQSIFFAIKGERQNGHDFIHELIASGVKVFVIERDIENINSLSGITVFKVESSIRALQNLAAWHRSKYKFPVLAITGSNAKTIIKEWIGQLLSPEYSVVRSPKSYNSQIGVPLSVWQMNENHTFGVFEAGISRSDEMECLQVVIKPTIGLFTNIGSAHDEGFYDRTHKIIEKLKLFENVKKLIYCNDYTDIEREVQKKKIKTVTWSFFGKSDYKVNYLQINALGATVTVQKQAKPNQQAHIFEIPYSDSASVENALHCVVLLFELGFNSDVIQKKIANIKPVSMRLEMKQAVNGCYVIDDTYNNDLAGLTIALDFLNNQKQREQKTLILSDLLETGLNKRTLYQKIEKVLKEKSIHKFIGIGNDIISQRSVFDKNAELFATVEDFIEKYQFNQFRDEIILVKGARAFGFERIVSKLQFKTHRTVFEISLDALVHNLNYYKSKLNPNTKLMVMVKSFAYGAGSLEVANLLQFHRVDYLAVAYTDEAVKLRESGITLKIMVMNASEDDFDQLIAYKLEPAVYSLPFLSKLVDYILKTDKSIFIHLELETGMNRLGIAQDEIKKALDLLQKSDKVHIASVFSHLAGADEERFEKFTKEQFENLQIAVKEIRKAGYHFMTHILNSAGILRYPEMHMDMVRLGIGLYGVEANQMEQTKLVPIGTLKTTVSQVKKIKMGSTVGYSRNGRIKKDTTIAVIGIGYGDGYNRAFSNGVGKVWVGGKLAPVIGNVCMDMTMIDVTDIAVKEGDEVEIFGKNISISDMALWIHTIPYEILTSVSERVKRVFYSE